MDELRGEGGEEGADLEEPRKMQPNITTRTVVRMRALRGMACLEWTWAKSRLAGRPPSLGGWISRGMFCEMG